LCSTGVSGSITTIDSRVERSRVSAYVARKPCEGRPHKALWNCFRNIRCPLSSCERIEFLDRYIYGAKSLAKPSRTAVSAIHERDSWKHAFECLLDVGGRGRARHLALAFVFFAELMQHSNTNNYNMRYNAGRTLHTNAFQRQRNGERCSGPGSDVPRRARCAVSGGAAATPGRVLCTTWILPRQKIV